MGYSEVVNGPTLVYMVIWGEIWSVGGISPKLLCRGYLAVGGISNQEDTVYQ